MIETVDTPALAGARRGDYLVEAIVRLPLKKSEQNRNKLLKRLDTMEVNCYSLIKRGGKTAKP